ncbi:MAG: hypothetical protein JNN15_00865 [Blastocatellia bacterium]|nr:hypothetical protein [Blastocatellia bacterium]
MINAEVIQKIAEALGTISVFALGGICCAIGSGVTATVLTLRAFWPNMSEKLDLVALGYSWRKRFLMGLINGPAIFILAAIALNIPVLKLAGLGLLLFLVMLILLGLTAEFTMIGRRVLAMRNQPSTPFAQTITGGIIFTLMFLIPFLGQGIFLAILLKSVGTTIYWLFKQRNFTPPSTKE